MSFTLDLRYHICMQPIELPVFNTVALELLQLLSDQMADIDEVIKTINKDPALAIQILKMANSPVYAGRYKSETINDSVKRLGIRQITNLAMAASQAALHASESPIVNRMMQGLWLHAHSCALGCRSIAISSGHREIADQAYLGGLLHDIGKLYLLKAMEQIHLHSELKFDLDLDTLLDVFSDMHVEQGCRIMDFWEIPSLYYDVVARHHLDSPTPDDTLLAIVRLVNFQSRHYGLNPYPQFIKPEHINPEIAALNLSEEALEKLEKDMTGAGEEKN